ncbi:MAG: cytochrome c [Rhodospirillaceae bacterium]
MDNKPKPPRDSFSVKAVGTIGASALMAGLLAFIVIPTLTGREDGLDVFTALCRAIGLSVEAPSRVTGHTAGSTVALDPATSALLAAGDPEKGAVIAGDICVSCHLTNGDSSDPNTIPTIAGQSARAIYKQLRDLKTGARVSEVMKPIAEGLDEKQMSDLAAYFDGLSPRNFDNPEVIAISESTRALIEKGDASRALPACAACHEARAGGPWEAPNLTGQYPAYIDTQLKAYAEGKRRNDLYGRMRIIAKKLTPQEMRELSAHYNAPAYPF